MSYTYGKQKSYWWLKVLIAIIIYVTGCLTGSWWVNQYYNSRVKLANAIMPDTIHTVVDTIQIDTIP